jgi:hypothetical protein
LAGAGERASPAVTTTTERRATAEKRAVRIALTPNVTPSDDGSARTS